MSPLYVHPHPIAAEQAAPAIKARGYWASVGCRIRAR